MPDEKARLLESLAHVVASQPDRTIAMQSIADEIRASGNYRWVGLYDVNRVAGLVINVVFSGPGAPDYPTFPIGKGLTNAAIASGRSVNVGDVATDPRYLSAFGSTRSEIIVPVFDAHGRIVVGTLDVESELHNAFSPEVEELLTACERTIRVLWSPEGRFGS